MSSSDYIKYKKLATQVKDISNNPLDTRNTISSQNYILYKGYAVSTGILTNNSIKVNPLQIVPTNKQLYYGMERDNTCFTGRNVFYPDSTGTTMKCGNTQNRLFRRKMLPLPTINTFKNLQYLQSRKPHDDLRFTYCLYPKHIQNQLACYK